MRLYSSPYKFNYVLICNIKFWVRDLAGHKVPLQSYVIELTVNYDFHEKGEADKIFLHINDRNQYHTFACSVKIALLIDPIRGNVFLYLNM